MPTFQIPQLRPNQVAIIIGALGVLAVLVIAYFFFRKPSADVGTPVTLTVWGTEPDETMQPLLEGYRALRPNVTYAYRQIDPAGYRAQVLDALAAGTGPDVFAIPSTDVGAMASKIAPTPTALTPAFVQANFPKAVEADVVDDGIVRGLPLSLDTLALIYNRDLLDAAGITSPPATWDEVAAAVPRLAAVDDQGQVQRSAIALGGTSASVRDAADILSLLMLQNGAPLSNQAHSSVSLDSQGAAALRFYTQFANPASTAYTWNDQLGDSFQQFADGKLALLVAYPSALAELKERNAFLDARLAPVPQAAGGTPKSFGTYPVLTVSRQSPNATWGWDLVQTITTDKALMTAYAERTGRAPALTSLIAEQIKVPATTVAATQALQARSWFQWDGTAARNEIDRAISSIINGTADPTRAANVLEERLRALIRQ